MEIARPETSGKMKNLRCANFSLPIFWWRPFLTDKFSTQSRKERKATQ